MLDPSSIELTGLERHSSLSTPIGRIELRWTRESESLFGRTPERATIEAANAVGKALRQSSFPSRLKYLSADWQIVFLSKDLKAGQVPSQLISNCHPGWMTPPANIYIAAEQAAGSCGGSAPARGAAADAQLAQVLIHELGHVVEYNLAPQAGFDRARAEGFATWFEVFAGKYSLLLNSSAILSQQKMLARQRAVSGDSTFRGGADDYALAGSIFHVLTESRTVSELARAYEIASSERAPFNKAVQKVTGWSDRQLEDKVREFLK